MYASAQGINIPPPLPLAPSLLLDPDPDPGVDGKSAVNALRPEAPGLAAILFELLDASNGGGMGLGALLLLLFPLLLLLAPGVPGPKFNSSDALELVLDKLDRIEESLLLEATVVQNNVDIGSIWHCLQVPGFPVHPPAESSFELPFSSICCCCCDDDDDDGESEEDWFGLGITVGTAPGVKLVISRISTDGPGCITGRAILVLLLLLVKLNCNGGKVLWSLPCPFIPSSCSSSSSSSTMTLSGPFNEALSLAASLAASRHTHGVSSEQKPQFSIGESSLKSELSILSIDLDRD